MLRSFGLICLLGTLGLTNSGLQEPTHSPFKEKDAKLLLGLTRAEVLDTIGVPDSVIGGVGTLSFHYRDGHGAESQVLFHRDIAVFVNAPDAPFVHGRPLPDEGVYLGQGVAQLIERSAAAESFSVGPHGIELEFGGKTVGLTGGSVTSIAAKD